MSGRQFDQAYRAAREHRVRGRRRAKLWRRLRIASSWLLLALMAGLIGYGVWLMASK